MQDDSDRLQFEAANPWAVVNIAQPGWKCGRYPSRLLAILAADTWPRLVEISHLTHTVFVSDIPLANPKPEIAD